MSEEIKRHVKYARSFTADVLPPDANDYNVETLLEQINILTDDIDYLLSIKQEK